MKKILKMDLKSVSDQTLIDLYEGTEPPDPSDEDEFEIWERAMVRLETELKVRGK